MKQPPAYIAKHIRTVIENGGSAPHTEEVQRFFKHEVKSRGWYTGELRKLAVRFRRTILAERGMEYLLQVADQLFRGDVLEEKVFAVLMLQGMVENFGKPEFKLFESWLDRVSTWADHDALVHYLIGPMIAADVRIAVAAASLGQEEDAQTVAPARRRREPHPQHAAAQELRRYPAHHRDAVDQQRRHGPERTGLAPARGGKSESAADRRIPDDDSRSHAEAGAADGVRDAAGQHAQASAREKEVNHGFTRIMHGSEKRKKKN